MKRVISVILCFIMISAVPVFAETGSLDEALNSAADYLYKAVPNPSVKETGGEWTVLSLLLSNAEIKEEYFNTYLKAAADYIKEADGVLSKVKYTEYSRVILALTALGKDASDFSGFDLTAPLYDFDKTVYQGINGPVWALIALDFGGFEGEEIRSQYLNYILEREIEVGGWALSKNASAPEADITAMTLLALKNYEDNEKIRAAIERGTEKLSSMQSVSGGFPGFEKESSESTAWAVIALSALEIPYDDQRFIKDGNSLLDNLLSFQNEDGGFSHLKNSPSDLMATEQACLALISLKRAENKMPHIFKAPDDIDLSDDNIKENADRHPDVKKSEVILSGITFPDIESSIYKNEIEVFAARGIINGTDSGAFNPKGTVTRAEFAGIVVKALGLPERQGKEFSDADSSDWFYSYVNTACAYGIVNGVSETLFNPNGNISREEAAVMAARAAKLAGLDTSLSEAQTRDILAAFTDYMSISEWAKSALAFCYKENLLDDSTVEIEPKLSATREQVTAMLYNLLLEAELL